MDDNATSLMETKVGFRCFKKDTYATNRDQPFYCRMIVQGDGRELIFITEPSNEEKKVVCLHQISLGDVVSFTLRTGREEAMDTWNISNSVFSSVIVLEMLNGEVVEIGGLPISEVTSLLKMLESQLQQQQRVNNKEGRKMLTAINRNEEKTSLSRLEKYIASKDRGTTLSYESPLISPSVMLPQSSNTGDVKKGVLKPRRVNKYTAILQKKGIFHHTGGLSHDMRVEQLQCNVIMHLTPIGVTNPIKEGLNHDRWQSDDKSRRKLAEGEGEEVNLSLLHLDPLNSNMTSSLDNQQKLSLFPWLDGTNSGEYDSGNVNNDGDAAIAYASALKATDGMTQRRREVYLLKKLEEKSSELEKARTELRFAEEVVRRKTEEGLLREQMLLEKYKYLTPAQRALIDFDALLKPVLTVEEVQREEERKQQQQQRHSTRHKLQHNRQLSKMFIEQLQERSFTTVDTVPPKVSLTSQFEEETASPHANKQLDSQKLFTDNISVTNETSTEIATHMGKSTLPPLKLELSQDDLPPSPPSPPAALPIVTTMTTTALTQKPSVNTSSAATAAVSVNLPPPPAGLPPPRR
ncbi:hypothetical protein LSM04_003204 [Trypanosoma melophagium]|uniref:uncharacterized protein n=1 Tax=Trypanosoma melophagium TaxID=715481 RepID=UPI00351A1E77|nr:hypothetical protein LSM04_003204 [Trypanosoma melophagium]